MKELEGKIVVGMNVNGNFKSIIPLKKREEDVVFRNLRRDGRLKLLKYEERGEKYTLRRPHETSGYVEVYLND